MKLKMSLLLSILNESILGRRGIIKRSSIWLPLAFSIQLQDVFSYRESFFLSLYLIISVQCWGMTSIFVNDIRDMLHDRETGKNRWIAQLPKWKSCLIIISFALTGFLFILFTGRCAIVSLYLCGMFFGYFYSLPPFRFKDRGILGLFSYGIATTAIYSVIPGMLFNMDPSLLLCMSCSIFMDKWVNLHFHQVTDYDGDMNTGLKTYAVKRGIRKARIVLKNMAHTASLAMLFLLLVIILLEKTRFMQYLMIMISVAVITSIFIYYRGYRKNRADISHLLQELPWCYLGLTYLLFRVLPPLMFIELTTIEPVFWVMAFLSLLSMVGGTFYYSRYSLK